MEIELPILYEPNSLLSSAVQNYLRTNKEQYVQVWLNEQKEHPYQASYFLRTETEMPELEQIAVSVCSGKILDIGAGAGAHSLSLAAKKHDVTALESDSGFCELLAEIKNIKVIKDDFFTWKPTETYDTILLLMNGLGIAQKSCRLAAMVHKLKNLLTESGKVLVEVTDYKFSPEYDHDIMSNPEAVFRLMYEGKFSPEFYWLYPNVEMLETHCNAEKMNIKVLYQEDETLLLELSK